MPSTFIVTNFGIPRIASELTPFETDRRGTMSERWVHFKAFDNLFRYELKPRQLPSYSKMQRLFAHLGYNPRGEVEFEWTRTGECRIEDIISEVDNGLQDDDDIIQQWFSADDVLKLLRSARSFEELVDRVKCVCGEFETDSHLRKIVDAVLPENAA